MSGLERIRLKAARRESSALLSVVSPELLEELGVDRAWWTCHDEGDVGDMVSLVCLSDDEWSIRSIKLGSAGPERTDAEALARVGDAVFVFGSSFVDKSGSFDGRRAFVARFSEAGVVRGSNTAEVLSFGRDFFTAIAEAVARVALLAADDDGEGLINIEGAAFVGSDLLLGLRWPVAADGQPLLIKIAGAAAVLTASEWNVADLVELDIDPIVVDVGASPKRPAGVRCLAVDDNSLHVLVGQTERGLASKKVKAAAARHRKVTGALDVARVATDEVKAFEGFRKVEGLAPAGDRGWLYALDDEDAIILLTD